MKDSKPVPRSAAYEQRQKASGLVKVCVWVPAAKADNLKLHAEMLRGK